MSLFEKYTTISFFTCSFPRDIILYKLYPKRNMERKKEETMQSRIQMDNQSEFKQSETDVAQLCSAVHRCSLE